MLEVRYPIRDDTTGREGVLRLAGGIWSGDVCGFEFADTVYGLAGTATCDWREPRTRLWVDEGVPADQGAQALLDRISTLLLPFHRGAFRHLTQDDMRRCGGRDCSCGAHSAFAAVPEPEPLAHLLEQAVRLVDPKKVLDVGCTAGDVVRLLRERGIDAHGFDVGHTAEALAGQDVGAFLRTGALAAIPFGPEHAFDTLLALDLFEHTPEHRLGAMIGEFARLGVRRVVAQISLCEFQYAGHVTLRPLSWWDRQLAPWFHRVAPPNQRDIALAFDADPSRYLRVYELASVPVAA